MASSESSAAGAAISATIGTSAPSLPRLIPCVVLSGWLGAGKTTLLTNILNNRHGIKVAVFVNDMASVNIDAKLLKGGGGSATLLAAGDQLVEFHNGCVCCTLRPELLKQVIELLRPGAFDYCVIEASGISEPMPIAEIFDMPASEHSTERLSDFARLDAAVTLVDSATFNTELSTIDSLADRQMATGAGDKRSVVELLIDQVEFADVIILNKTDLVSPSQLAAVRAVVTRLNPDAEVICSRFSDVPLEKVLNTGRFDLEKARAAPGWLRSLAGQHIPESVEFGITSFVFRRRRPFHPGRLWALLHGAERGRFEHVVRSKGSAWFATEWGNEHSVSWSGAGKVYRLAVSSAWWVTVGREDWPEDQVALIESTWDAGGLGDRQQELVFIGVGMDAAAVEAALDEALLSEAEYAAGPEGWSKLDEPFKLWDALLAAEAAADAEHDHEHSDDDEEEEDESDGDGVGGSASAPNA